MVEIACILTDVLVKMANVEAPLIVDGLVGVAVAVPAPIFVTVQTVKRGIELASGSVRTLADASLMMRFVSVDRSVVAAVTVRLDCEPRIGPLIHVTVVELTADTSQ